jgi:hypothetical protein
MSGALLEVAVGRNPDQRDRDLLGAERLGEGTKLARDVRTGVGVVDVVGPDDREVGADR